jgi:hypothetical protein
MGGGGAQRPVWRGNELKKTGARTRGQCPLVKNIYHGYYLVGLFFTRKTITKNILPEFYVYLFIEFISFI